MTQEFFISTIPTAQARPKFTTIAGHPKAYDPAKSRGYKLDVKYQVMDRHPQKMSGPLAMTIKFNMPRLKSHYGKKGLKTNAPKYHEVKPDTSNLLKAVEDALTGVLWHDDSQLSIVVATKQYSEVPGIWISVEEAK